MASWTSVSLISTSAWFGPGSSPIISPSRWNPIVASNMSVLSVHNHSGSAGEGNATFSASEFPTVDVQYIYPWFPVVNTGWVIERDARWPGGAYMTTCTLGAVLEYDVYLRDTGGALQSWQWQAFIASDSDDDNNHGGAISACIGGSPIGVGHRYVNGLIISGSFDISDGVYVWEHTINPTAGNNGRKILRLQCTNPLNAALQTFAVRIGYMKIKGSFV